MIDIKIGDEVRLKWACHPVRMKVVAEALFPNMLICTYWEGGQLKRMEVWPQDIVPWEERRNADTQR